jgi:hypothetical protein
LTMIDLNELHEWRHRDPENGLIMPWLTKPALDEICTWDLSRERVFEYGVGQSTLWWANKCEWLYGVDTNEEWVKAIHDAVISNSSVACLPVEDIYVNSIRTFKNIDIVVVDGNYRDRCIYQAIAALKPGGKLIIDNWQQPSVDWMPSEETVKLVTQLQHTIYPQEGHPDWKTLIAAK